MLTLAITGETAQSQKPHSPPRTPHVVMVLTCIEHELAEPDAIYSFEVVQYPPANILWVAELGSELGTLKMLCLTPLVRQKRHFDSVLFLLKNLLFESATFGSGTRWPVGTTLRRGRSGTDADSASFFSVLLSH